MGQRLGVELLGDLGEIADVGEHHRQLAQLAAELQQLGVAAQLLDDGGRQILAEGPAHMAPLALGAQIAQAVSR